MARRTVADFLEHFVLPLVRGGDMQIARPLTVDEVERFAQDLVHAPEALVAVDEARAEVLAEVVVRPPSLVLDADELRLAAALHNVLFLAHPDVDAWTVSRKTRARVAETARRLAAQPLTRSRRRVLARHGLLHNIFHVQRHDTRVSWWTGSANFLGQRPPARLVSWQSVRRVRQDVTTASYGALLSSDEALPIMSILLRRSPLTQLLSSDPHAPSLHWEDAVFLLRDPELARAVAYWALDPDKNEDQLAAPARYAAALEQMLERNPESADVRAVVAFLVHLSALLAHAEIRQSHWHGDRQRSRSARSPLLAAALAPERAGKRPRGLTTFLALPAAVAQVDPRLARPPGVDEDERLRARWDSHRDQVAESLGDVVIETLARRLIRRLDVRGLLPPAPPPAGAALPAAAPPALPSGPEPGTSEDASSDPGSGGPGMSTGDGPVEALDQSG